MKSLIILLSIAYGSLASAQTIQNSHIEGQYKGIFTSHEVIMELELAKDKKYYWAFTAGAMDDSSQGTWAIDKNILTLSPNPNESLLPPELIVKDKSSNEIKNDLKIRVEGTNINSKLKLKLKSIVLTDSEYIEIISKKLNEQNEVEFKNINKIKDLSSILLNYSYDDIEQGKHFTIEPTNTEIVLQFVESENQLIPFKTSQLLIQHSKDNPIQLQGVSGSLNMFKFMNIHSK